MFSMINMIILFFSFLLFSLNSWQISIFSLDEAKNASCAREMLERGDLIVPTFNYELRTDKPPVHYWFMMLAYKIFGINEFSARFFSALSGSFTVLLTFLFARRYFGQMVGILSTLVLLSSIHFVFQFHMAVPDPYLTFFLTLAFFSFYDFYTSGKKYFLYLFYTSIGLSILTKGPVGLILPGLIILVFLIVQKNIPFIKKMDLHIGSFIILAITLPWYIAVTIKTNGIWMEEFLFKHNIGRFSDSMEGHGGTPLLTFLFIFIGMLPFSIFLPQTVNFIRRQKQNSGLVYLSLIVFIYTTFFAISKTKLPNYTVPVYPHLSILIAYHLSNLDMKRGRVIYNLLAYLILTIFMVMALYFGLEKDKHLFMFRDYSLYFIILTIGSLFSIYYYFKENLQKVINSLVISSILMSFVALEVIMPKIDIEGSTKRLMKFIDTSKKIGYYKRYNPAFSFYIGKKIHPLSSPEDVGKFVDETQVYIITREEFVNELTGLNLRILAKKKDLFENPTSVILTNSE